MIVERLFLGFMAALVTGVTYVATVPPLIAL